MSTVRKLRGLVTPVDDHVLKTTLSATAADVTNMADFTAVGATTENRRWWHNPAADGPFGGRLFQYPHRLDTGTHDFVISDMCGRVAVVRPAGTDQLLVANLVQLFGIEHQVGHFPTSDIAIQDSLF